MLQDKRLVLLPSLKKEKLGQLCSNNVHPLFIWTEEHIKQDAINTLIEYKKTVFKELYLLDDKAPIEVGDYVYNPNGDCILLIDDNIEDDIVYINEEYSKVIATTDDSLILPMHLANDRYDNVPFIKSDFIKLFVEKQGKIDRVNVKYNEYDISTLTSDTRTYPNLSVDTLKLTENFVTLSLIEEERGITITKMYSREEVEARLWQLANKIDDAYRPYHRQNIIGYSLVKEFIINNLK